MAIELTSGKPEPLTEEIKVLIRDNLEGKLSRAEATRLRDRIVVELGRIDKDGKPTYGSSLDDCLCPKCSKPLSLTFSYGVACLYSCGGCGSVGKELIKDQAVAEDSEEDREYVTRAFRAA